MVRLFCIPRPQIHQQKRLAELKWYEFPISAKKILQSLNMLFYNDLNIFFNSIHIQGFKNYKPVILSSPFCNFPVVY